MKYLLAGLLLLQFAQPVFSQTDSDTTVYAVAEVMPMPNFPTCRAERHPGWTTDSTRHCSENLLLSLLAKNIRYPLEARQKNVQGMVVASFVVEKDGHTSGYKILRDIGSGCGEEAVRILKAIDAAGLRWLPGQNGGKPVRTSYTVPLRFRLEEAKPFTINNFGDSIYVQVETPVAFRGGLDSLAKFIADRSEYPRNFVDSCRTGIVEMSLIVYPNGQVRVDNLLDFNNLGGDFRFNAIRLANRTNGFWTPATFGGKAVASTATVRVPFKSAAPGCATANADFYKAILLTDEAVAANDSSNMDLALAKINEALRLHPGDSECLYYRAQMFLALNKKDEACADFSEIKRLLGFTWFEHLGRIVCGW